MEIREANRLKKIYLIFAITTVFALTSLAVFAGGNYLHTITLEKNNTGYNIILDSDKMVKVKKTTPSDNEVILELSGVASLDTVNALYKGVSDIDNFVVENTSSNKLKVYISAKNIAQSTVMVNPQNGDTVIVGEQFPIDRVLWAVFVLLVFSSIFKVAKKVSEEEDKILIKKDIKDREIELYRRYRHDIENSNFGRNMKMNNILKKIDRKIDERLTSSIK